MASNNMQTAFAKTLGTLATSQTTMSNAKAQLTMDIVETVRHAPDMNAAIILTMTERKGDEETTHDVTYAECRTYALGESDAAGDLLNRIIGSTASGRKLLEDLRNYTKDRNDLRKRGRKGGLLRVEKDRLDELDGKTGLVKEREGERNTLVQSIGRAIRVACYIIEQAQHTSDTYAFTSLRRAGTRLVYDAPTGDFEGEGEEATPVFAPFHVPVTECANNFAAQYVEWTTPEEEKVSDDASDDDDAAPDTGDATPDDAAPDTGEGDASTDQRAPHDNVSKEETAVRALLKDAKGKRAIIDATATILAAFDEDNAPRGEERDALLHLYSALGRVFTVDQVKAWEKKNVAS